MGEVSRMVVEYVVLKKMGGLELRRMVTVTTALSADTREEGRPLSLTDTVI